MKQIIYGIFTLVVVLVLVVTFIPAQVITVEASKPKLTAYPAPNVTFDAQAYPIPPTPLVQQIPSTYEQLVSYDPNADPILGVPYGWGEFTVTDRYGNKLKGWWVTIQGVGKVEHIDGNVCIGIIGNIAMDCKILLYYEYIENIDMNVAYSPFIRICNKWTEFRSIYWLNYGNWREPNRYFQYCIYLPTNSKSG